MADADHDALFLRACRREPVPRTPVWIMRQAGRYLPEYRVLRAKVDFLTSCRTPEIACELTLQPVRRLGVDAAILFSDILIPLPGMGVPVTFDPGPHIDDPVRSAGAIDALRVPDARETTPFVMEAVRLLRRELPAGVPLIGFAGAPFTVATYLVEGGGSKSFAEIKTLLFKEPALAHRLLSKCADTIASYLVEQVRAGAQAAMLFDTWAGILSPDDYRSFARPYAQRVFEAVAKEGPTAPRIYYAGESAGWLEALPGVGADVIGLDWRIGLAAARRRLGPTLALQGNLDPGVLLGDKQLMTARVEDVLREAATPLYAEPAGSHLSAPAVDVDDHGAIPGADGPKIGLQGWREAGDQSGPSRASEVLRAEMVGLDRASKPAHPRHEDRLRPGGPGDGGPSAIQSASSTTVSNDDAQRLAPALGHVFNLGHGILPSTPPDHALLLVETVHRLTSRP